MKNDIRFNRYNRAIVLCFIFSVAAVLPLEPRIGGVFLRPIMLVTLVISILMMMSALLSDGKVTNCIPSKGYVWPMLLLAAFFLLQGVTIGVVYVGIKEFIEVIASLTIMVLLISFRSTLGLIHTLKILRNASFIVSICWVVYNFSIDNYVTYKDPYWILLVSTVLSVVFLKLDNSKLNVLMLLILIPLDVLSASRTLWVVVLLVVVILFDIRRLIAPFIMVFFLVLVSAMFNKQYSYYYESVNFLINNFGAVVEDVTILNQNIENKSDKVRITELLRSLAVFFDNPFFGVGVDQYIETVNNSPKYGGNTNVTAHNEFVRVLAEGGVVLFICYAFLYRKIWVSIKSSSIDKGTVVIAHAFICASLALALLTATNYMIHFLLQLSVLFLPGYLGNHRENNSCSKYAVNYQCLNKGK